MTTRTHAIIAAAFVVIFMAIGLVFGAEPDSATANGFGDVLRAFAREPQTRTIVAAILVDLVTGVLAALRSGTFDGQQLARFLASNVIPYLLGYMLLWFLSFFGFADLLPSQVNTLLADFGFGAVMATLSISIIDNLSRARSVPPASRS